MSELKVLKSKEVRLRVIDLEYEYNRPNSSMTEKHFFEALDMYKDSQVTHTQSTLLEEYQKIIKKIYSQV